MTLWIAAREDAEAAVTAAALILQSDESPARRFVAVHLVAQIKCDTAHQLLCEAMTDGELIIACHAVDSILDCMDGDDTGIDPACLRQNCDALLTRVRKAPKAPLSLVWPWVRIKPSADSIESLKPDEAQKGGAQHLEEPSPEEPVTAEPIFSIAEMQAQAFALPPEAVVAYWREHLLRVSSAYEAINASQMDAILNGTHDSDESPFQAHLRDLRWAIMDELVAKLPDEALRTSQDWLSQDEKTKLEAGMELLRRLCLSLNHVTACRETTQAYLMRKNIKREFEIPSQLKDILNSSCEGSLIWEVIGKLVDRSQLTEPALLVHRDIATKRPTARLIVQALNEWLWEHRERMITVDSDEPKALFEMYGPYPDMSKSLEDDVKRFPLAADLREWWESRSESLRDDDGLELERASLFVADGMASAHDFDWPVRDVENFKKARSFVENLYGDTTRVTLHKRAPVENLLRWLLRMHPSGYKGASFLLDVLENRLLAQQTKAFRGFWASWRCRQIPFSALQKHDAERLWHATVRMLRAWDGEVYPFAAVEAHAAGVATDSDLAFYILGQTDPINRQCLRAMPPTKGGNIANTRRVMAACASLVVEHELNHQGQAATVFGKACMEVGSIQGACHVLKCVLLLGNDGPERSADHGLVLRQTVLTHILRIGEPAKADTTQSFAVKAKELGLTELQLVVMAVFAPVWALFVEHVLGTPGFADMVWWLHAHTRGSRLFLERGSETWQAEVRKRSDIAIEEFKDGAVDVVWFHQAYKLLGERLWGELEEASLFTNAGGGDMQAKLYASAILGQLNVDESETSILKKRHQDSVRALSLVPLPTKTDMRRKEVRRRHEVLQEFRRGTHKFGAERRLNEERAAALALDCLARNAGYEDPIRMEWDLEAEAVRRLIADAAKFCLNDLTCSLHVNSAAEAVLSVMRAGKDLKTVPPELRKHADYTALKTAREDLQVRCRRARAALEDFMVRRVIFTGEELRGLLEHPLLSPLLGALVLVSGENLGLPAESGACLRDADGKSWALDAKAPWFIAHSHDLLPAASWAAWQSFIVREHIVQPFKQVFRELYVPVAGEDEKGVSRRYARHTLKPAQALALIGQRGWLYSCDDGARRIMRHAGIVAVLSFEEYFHVPSQVETITVADVRFERLGPGLQPSVALLEVPPVLFSEVMRDLDLMVSVAWTGQGEPQYTPATIGMRAALIRAVADALKLTNIEITERHARIQGQFGSYRVHLGSAVVMKSDSGMIWLSAVVKDAREPLFLPFADADPGTAEVLAKVLLLAQDHTIKNAELIRQLRES